MEMILDASASFVAIRVYKSPRAYLQGQSLAPFQAYARSQLMTCQVFDGNAPPANSTATLL